MDLITFLMCALAAPIILALVLLVAFGFGSIIYVFWGGLLVLLFKGPKAAEGFMGDFIGPSYDD